MRTRKPVIRSSSTQHSLNKSLTLLSWSWRLRFENARCHYHEILKHRIWLKKQMYYFCTNIEIKKNKSIIENENVECGEKRGTRRTWGCSLLRRVWDAAKLRSSEAKTLVSLCLYITTSLVFFLRAWPFTYLI